MFCGKENTGTVCGQCVIGEIALFSYLDNGSLRKLRSLAAGAYFPSGRTIVEQGQEQEHVFVITRGLVKLYRLTADGQRQITGFLGAGDLLGSIKRNAQAYCTAEAMTDVEACSIQRANFTNFLQDQPRVCFNLLVAATDEIEARYDHSILLARKHANGRLAAFLLLMALRWRSLEDAPVVIHVPMPRSDIADHLGLTTETVSRVLSQFKNRGIIEFQGPKTIVLRSIAALYDLAGLEELPRPRMAMGL